MNMVKSKYETFAIVRDKTSGTREQQSVLEGAFRVTD